VAEELIQVSTTILAAYAEVEPCNKARSFFIDAPFLLVVFGLLPVVKSGSSLFFKGLSIVLVLLMNGSFEYA